MGKYTAISTEEREALYALYEKLSTTWPGAGYTLDTSHKDTVWIVAGRSKYNSVVVWPKTSGRYYSTKKRVTFGIEHDLVYGIRQATRPEKVHEIVTHLLDIREAALNYEKDRKEAEQKRIEEQKTKSAALKTKLQERYPDAVVSQLATTSFVTVKFPNDIAFDINIYSEDITEISLARTSVSNESVIEALRNLKG